MTTTLLQFFTIISFVSTNFMSFAGETSNESNPTSSLYYLLEDVNSQWVHHADFVPQSKKEFNSDLDLIQFHLELVVQKLRSEPSISWSEDQFENRQNLLTVLEAYAERRIFPRNLYHSKRTPYFIDDFGVHCAVGYLIKESGHADLAKEISRNFNYDYIENIPSKKLADWAKQFGFTVDELKWIQPQYYPDPLDTLGNGTNGNVVKVVADNLNDRIVFIGDFNILDLQACLNIGVYENDQLSCLGGGLAGVVNDVHVTMSGVYVAGNMQANGTTYPAAFYDGTTWEYYGIPGRDGATGTLIHEFDTARFELVLEQSALNGNDEIWQRTPSASYLVAEANGPILDRTSSIFGTFYVGHFDSVTVNDVVPYVVPVTNVVHNQGLSGWTGIGAGVSDTVKTVLSNGFVMYFGGSCSDGPNSSGICISSYLNGSLQTLVTPNDFYDPTSVSVNDMEYFSAGQLYYGGRFSTDPLLGTPGSNLMIYDIGFGGSGGAAYLDKPVNSLTHLGDDLYVGGDFEFQSSQFVSPINHLGRFPEEPSSGLVEENLEINAYPNPFNHTITVEGFEANTRYSVYDLSGKTLRNNEELPSGVIDLSDLQNGTYILEVRTQTGIVTERIVKSSL